jgi:hypothetical protein
MWHLISNAPFDRDLELALIAANGVHAICFPCRRVLGGWIKAETKTPINVHPTHWRYWAKDSYKAGFKPMDAAPAQ